MYSYGEESCMCCTSKTIDKDCFEQCYRFSNIEIDNAATDSAILTLWESSGPVSSSGTLVFEITSFTTSTLNPPSAVITLDLLVDDVVVESGFGVDDKIIITSDDLNSIKIQAISSEVLIDVASLDFTIDLCVNVSYECC